MELTHRVDLDDMLAAAAQRIERYEPAHVPADVVIVDIRSEDTRARTGVVPGALHVPRTVLEWRVAPTSGWRTPHLQGTERLALLCDQGYSSVLAAAALVDLGLDAGDGGVSAGQAGRRTLARPRRHRPSRLTRARERSNNDRAPTG